MTERFNANSVDDGVGVSASGGPAGTGQDLTTLGVGQGSGQDASRQENNASIGFEFPIRWDDVASTLGRLGEKKYLGEFVDDMEMRDKMIEDYLTTNVVNGIVAGAGVAINRSQGVVTASISAAYLELLVPVGTIHPYPGATAPVGWLLCNGTSTAGLPILAALVGSTTPDMKGKVVVGLSAGESEFDTMFEAGGAKTVTLSAAQSGLQAHDHGIASQTFTGTSNQLVTSTNTDHVHSFQTSTFSVEPVRFASDTGEYVFKGFGSANTGAMSANASHQHNFTATGTIAVDIAENAAAGASSAHTNLQPYITLNYIIKHDY
jgi:hypothetical protein